VPGYIRKSVKHGGVSGSMRPNSRKTNILPGGNPRGDGKLQCGHAATQPSRYLARKKARREWDADVRRVCEACWQTIAHDPDSEWEQVDENYQWIDQTKPSPETDLERENRYLRTLANVLLSRLRGHPDWPLVQKLAGVCLAAEQLLNESDKSDPLHERLYALVMDREVVDFLIRMDRMNLLPDDRNGRLTALPSDLAIPSLLRTGIAVVSLEPKSKLEVQHTLIAQAVGNPIAEASRSGVTTE